MSIIHLLFHYSLSRNAYKPSFFPYEGGSAVEPDYYACILAWNMDIIVNLCHLTFSSFPLHYTIGPHAAWANATDRLVASY